jgi:hypothetical protein
LGGFRDTANVAADEATAASIYKAAQLHYATYGNLTDFDAADYIDDSYVSSKLTTAPTVETTGDPAVETGNITPVTYGLGTFPRP